MSRIYRIWRKQLGRGRIMAMRVVTLTLLVGLLANVPVKGQVAEEQLPAPKRAVPSTPSAPAPFFDPNPPPYSMFAPPPLPRLDSRNAWIYFAPNGYGQMRMRVIQAPYGSYYLYNGRPYYGLSTRSPYILGRAME
jgi:hypothetical protein